MQYYDNIYGQHREIPNFFYLLNIFESSKLSKKVKENNGKDWGEKMVPDLNIYVEGVKLR